MAQTLSLSDYDVYGFDVDHTLSKYNIPELFDTVYNAMAEFLISKKGYHKDLMQSFDTDFCCRGLVLDIKRGNMLKLSEDGTILRASHGTTFLSTNEICTEYGDERHWPYFEHLIDKVNNIADEFRIFENFFDIPGELICARIIDLKDQENGKRCDEYDYWSDVFDAYNYVYNPVHFEDHCGGFFDQFKEDTGRFLTPLNSTVKSWLKKLKSDGKKVIVISSAYHDFASHSLEFLFGEDWRSYFDLFVTCARKPGFFFNKRNFLRIDSGKVKEPVTELKENEMYSEGNSVALMKMLAEVTGKSHPKVLFVGDSIRSDVYPSKRFASWDTLLILEEMEAEQRLDNLKNEGKPPKRKRRRTMEPSDLEKEYLTSRNWGSLFTDDHLPEKTETKLMNTLWGFIIRKYADVAVPQLEYIADLPIDFKFPCFRHEEPREWGFYPKGPYALQSEAHVS